MEVTGQRVLPLTRPAGVLRCRAVRASAVALALLPCSRLGGVCDVKKPAALPGGVLGCSLSCGVLFAECSALCSAVPFRLGPLWVAEPHVLRFAHCASLRCFPAESLDLCCCPARTHRAGQTGRDAASLL